MPKNLTMNTENNRGVTTDLYKSLQVRCLQAGTNLAELCREAQVDRKTLDKWKRRTPKSIAMLRRLEAAIEKVESQNNA